MNHLFVAGFDFGTSYSKVVLRDQFTKELAKPVTFGRSGIGLLPSFVWTDGRRFACPLHEGVGKRVGYLKLLAADAVAGRSDFSALYSDHGFDLAPISRHLLVRYFLSIIQGTFDFLRRDSQWNDYARETDPLVFQLAVPVGLTEASANLESEFLKCLKVAWLMASDGGNVSDESTKEEIDDGLANFSRLSESRKLLLEKQCLVYPEVAAGVQTVLRSRSYPEGKYITMDVGAGTVDLNVFYRKKSPAGIGQGGNALNYWASRVEPLGCARLPDLHAGAGAHERPSARLSHGELKSRLEAALGNLMESAFRFQPTKVEGTGPSPWSHSTHAFIFGGGSNNPLYKQVFEEALRNLGISITEAQRLPAPDQRFLLPSDADSFGRFAVGFGLSYHRSSLDEVRLPSELKTFAEKFAAKWSADYRFEDSPCTCYSNPDCNRCGGTGIIKGELAQAAGIAVDFIERSNRASPAPKARMDPQARALSRWIDYYHRHSERLGLIEKYLLLKRLEALLKMTDLATHQHIRADAMKLLSAEDRRQRKDVVCLTDPVRRTEHGVSGTATLRSFNTVLVHVRAGSVTAGSEVGTAIQSPLKAAVLLERDEEGFVLSLRGSKNRINAGGRKRKKRKR